MKYLISFRWLMMVMPVLIIGGCKKDSASEDDTEDTDTATDSDSNDQPLPYEFPFELPDLNVTSELVGRWGDDNQRHIFNDDHTFSETEGDDILAEGIWSATDDVLTLFFTDDENISNRVSTTYAIYDGVLFLFEDLLVRTEGNASGPDGVFSRTIEREEWVEEDGAFQVEGSKSWWTVTLDGTSYLSEPGSRSWTLVDDEREYSDGTTPTSTAIFYIEDGLIYHRVEGFDDVILMGAMMDNSIILILKEEGETWDTWGYHKEN